MDVVVDGVVVQVVFVVWSPLSEAATPPGRSFGHHAAAQTRSSPEAEAAGLAPCSPMSVNTAPAVSTPM
ncbi:hypothetical protein BBK82_18495 [Lentzea guizhouensis]|uniref:Uncharacterized protein n=1 Tax=Lentzea guizhouensis TaxID=1586287 RepID=A0A1B2HJ59_9PSEU|nr:hypothetical protein [Lentzea guizhouensis]ANZ37751.1 hypothetical protein BBK82_18495 [Lentzea guizhouensis]